MKHRGTILPLAILAVLIAPVVAMAAGTQPPAGSPATDAQMIEWQTIQQMLTKEYGICLEHCGGSASCENKCDKVRTTKMNREHTRVFGKPMPTTDKRGS